MPAAGELELQALLDGARLVPQLRPLPRFPAVQRDLSLILTEKIRYADLQNAIDSLSLANLESVDHVTTYRGKPLEKGSKSVTIKLTFRSSAGTLTGEEVDGAVKRVVESTGRNFGATLRA
jgi:phenylalanyl-tRNA synthetase beta chain